jgi:hypothetical protein
MSSTSRNIVLSVALAISAALGWFWVSYGSHAPKGSDAGRDATPEPPVPEQPIAAYQAELLDLAFRAASAMPSDPHVKTRCRLQESVVVAALALDQPRRALASLERIEDWRRGAGYADLARYCVTHGASAASVEPYLGRADDIAEGLTKLEGFQDWQRDRIRAKIAGTYLAAGQPDRAERYCAGIVSSETGLVECAKASRLQDAAFDEQMRAVDAVVLAGDLDRVRNTLEACTMLHARFYADAGRRAKIETKVRSSSRKLPLKVQIDLRTALARAAIEHADEPKALELVAEARKLQDSAQWLSQDRIAMMAQSSELSWKAGDRASARRDVDAALALFDSEREKMVDIYRAGALRSLAEAHQAMGDTAIALKIYSRVFEEGVKNPNSRPRAEDFVATCLSMALQRVEPDPNLRARMRQIADSLGHPW